MWFVVQEDCNLGCLELIMKWCTGRPARQTGWRNYPHKNTNSVSFR